MSQYREITHRGTDVVPSATLRADSKNPGVNVGVMDTQSLTGTDLQSDTLNRIVVTPTRLFSEVVSHTTSYHILTADVHPRHNYQSACSIPSTMLPAATPARVQSSAHSRTDDDSGSESDDGPPWTTVERRRRAQRRHAQARLEMSKSTAAAAAKRAPLSASARAHQQRRCQAISAAAAHVVPKKEEPNEQSLKLDGTDNCSPSAPPTVTSSKRAAALRARAAATSMVHKEELDELSFEDIGMLDRLIAYPVSSAGDKPTSQTPTDVKKGEQEEYELSAVGESDCLPASSVPSVGDRLPSESQTVSASTKPIRKGSYQRKPTAIETANNPAISSVRGIPSPREEKTADPRKRCFLDVPVPEPKGTKPAQPKQLPHPSTLFDEVLHGECVSADTMQWVIPTMKAPQSLRSAIVKSSRKIPAAEPVISDPRVQRGRVASREREPDLSHHRMKRPRTANDKNVVARDESADGSVSEDHDHSIGSKRKRHQLKAVYIDDISLQPIHERDLKASSSLLILPVPTPRLLATPPWATPLLPAPTPRLSAPPPSAALPSAPTPRLLALPSVALPPAAVPPSPMPPAPSVVPAPPAASVPSTTLTPTIVFPPHPAQMPYGTIVLPSFTKKRPLPMHSLPDCVPPLLPAPPAMPSSASDPVPTTFVPNSAIHPHLTVLKNHSFVLRDLFNGRYHSFCRAQVVSYTRHDWRMRHMRFDQLADPHPGGYELWCQLFNAGAVGGYRFMRCGTPALMDGSVSLGLLYRVRKTSSAANLQPGNGNQVGSRGRGGYRGGRGRRNRGRGHQNSDLTREELKLLRAFLLQREADDRIDEDEDDDDNDDDDNDDDDQGDLSRTHLNQYWEA